MLLSGNSEAQAVVRVVTMDDDGQVHFTILPGSVWPSTDTSSIEPSPDCQRPANVAVPRDR